MRSLLFSFLLLPFYLAALSPLVRAEVESSGPYPWTQSVPADICKDFVEPNCFLTEKQEEWRATLQKMFTPYIKDCTNAETAVLTVAGKIGDITGAYYTVERRTAVMSAMEALREKKVSCSGQSILLASALRSVGIPARLVGVATWAHVRGNHTWCEAWLDGEWKMIEFNEKAFNTPWVMENVALLNPKQNPNQCILAASGGAKPTFCIDRSQHYEGLSKAWAATQGGNVADKRLCVEVLSSVSKQRCVVKVALYDAKGNLIKEGKSPSGEDDMRQFLSFNVPREPRYTLKLQALSGGDEILREIEVTDAPVQVIRLSIDI